MEDIRQAIERARAQSERQSHADLEFARNRVNGGRVGPTYHAKEPTDVVDLDLSHLQSHKIVAYDGTDTRSRPFDILRTEVLRSMDLKGWKILAVTSPTPSCGKTLVAINLALSMGRQPERLVFLADVDLRRPCVATSLGLKRKEGLVDVVEGRIELDTAVVQIRAGSSRLAALPTTPATNASDLIDSNAFATVMRDVTEYGQSHVIVLDLPPLLTGHDVISILPRVDCVLLVGAVGVSTTAEIEECSKYLQTTDVVRFVLNKVPESQSEYAYY